MVSDVTQRWRERRDSFRQRGEAFYPSAYGGVLLDGRSLSKIRNEEDGGASYERYLVALGAPSRSPGQPPRDWLPLALERGPFTRTRHPGNLVYLFDPAGLANDLPAGSCPALPYVKRRDLESTS